MTSFIRSHPAFAAFLLGYLLGVAVGASLCLAYWLSDFAKRRAAKPGRN